MVVELTRTQESTVLNNFSFIIAKEHKSDYNFSTSSLLGSLCVFFRVELKKIRWSFEEDGIFSRNM